MPVRVRVAGDILSGRSKHCMRNGLSFLPASSRLDSVAMQVPWGIMGPGQDKGLVPLGETHIGPNAYAQGTRDPYKTAGGLHPRIGGQGRGHSKDLESRPELGLTASLPYRQVPGPRSNPTQLRAT